MSYQLNQDETRARTRNLDDAALRQLAELVADEMAARSTRRFKDDDYRRAGYTGLANFILGAARAMACRALLRASKGLVPYAVRVSPRLPGGTPTSGEMWRADEGATAALGSYYAAQTFSTKVDTPAWARVMKSAKVGDRVIPRVRSEGVRW